MAYDLVIKNGKIIDGSGMPAYSGDVAVKDGRIAEIGRVTDSAKRTINADGRAVSPGFIDHHTHLDAHLTWDPIGYPSPEHGVTTVITGNCGLSMMPAKPDHHSQIISTFVLVEAVPRSVLESVDWTWSSVGEYLGTLGQRLGVNVASLMGHNAVRQYVMGEDCTEREATPDEISAMQDAVRRGMEEGALGFTYNRNPTQKRDDGKPLPGHLASNDEMVALASVLSEYNAGVLQHGPMGKHRIENIDWFASLCRASGRPTIWHTLGWRKDDPKLYKAQLKHVEGYFKQGLPLYGNTQCVPGISTEDEDAVRELMNSPYVNIGMSDAGAHVERTGHFGLSSMVLGYWVREKKVMGLEAAVNCLTFKVASIYGLPDRGLVWPGFAADLAVWDPETVADVKPELVNDYPGGAQRMVDHAEGVYYTIVNGEVLMDEGKHTGVYPGRVLRNAWAERNN